MFNCAQDPELSSLLTQYDEARGVLDYIFLEGLVTGPPDVYHRAAALAGIAEIERRRHEWALRQASEENPIDKFWRVHCDEAMLTGRRISFATFWGADDRDDDREAYKYAFFHPPYGLGGSESEKEHLFAAINRHVLGASPERAEIFSWSTNWSTYFTAGHEWWGAYYWTIRPAGSDLLVVIGGSSTD